MNPFPSKSHVVNAILDGIKNAHYTNLEWTNNSAWLSIAPEYMMNIFIGQSIEKLSPKPDIWLEVPVKDLAESMTSESGQAKVIIEAIKRNNHENEKIDIVLDDNEHSRVIIEVKNAVSKWGAGIEKDIERISKALQQESTLEYGIFAFFANDKKNKIENIVSELELNAQDTVRQFNITITSIFEIIEDNEDDWSCAATVFILERETSINIKK